MTNSGPIYLEVAVAAPLDHTLTYAGPADAAAVLCPGLRVLVPLAGRLVTGYLLAKNIEPPAAAKAARQIKPIAEVLDRAPLFPANLIPFFRWVARYYQYPLGEVIKLALPGGLNIQSGRRIILTDEGRIHLTAVQAADSGKALSWLAPLLDRQMLTVAATRRLWRTKARRLLEQWAAQGWLEIKEELSAAVVRTKQEVCISRHSPAPGQEEVAQTPAEQKTWQLLAELAAKSGREAVPRRDLVRQYSGARQALKNLEKKGLLFAGEQPVYRDPFGECPPFYAAPAELTGEQQIVLDELLPVLSQQKFATFLLHGVTGSGKTEIYLRAAAAALAQSRSVLVLVPEIALATQLEGHFLSRFGERVALLHSGLSAGERFDQWTRIMSGQASVVIGARSAIFAPLHNLGLIVVDEEHEASYKQEDGLRYHARDLAVLRASLQHATVVLGSATPSVTSYFHAVQGKYKLLTIAKRVQDRALPQVNIVDLRKCEPVAGQPPLFSRELLTALGDNLASGAQSLVFLNRRGYANFMLCRQCGQTVQCRHCQISLTLHQGRKELLCHYCGYAVTSAVLCPHCQSGDLVAIGFGTERLEAELKRLFPQARIARLDRDTCLKRQDYLAVLNQVRARQVDILLGTQMITKGLHFPHVTLVGIIWADAGLGLPDFRAGERTFQLISQVAGRAGRGEIPGRVIVQTYQPEHYCIELARNNDYENLFKQEIRLRGQVGFPPYSRLINLRLESEDAEAVKDLAQRIAALAGRLPRPRQPVEVLGPAPAPLARLRGKYRWQFLLKGPDINDLHSFCHRLLDKTRDLAGSRTVRISVDVDPEYML